MNHRGADHTSARRLGSCRASIPHYDEFLSGECDLVIISGDFNNSVYWDKPSKRVKFNDFVEDLETRGYVSAYHHHHRCARGAEPHPTLWWKRNIESTYHIDYTFVSHAAVVDTVTVGEHVRTGSPAAAYSDHAPMTTCGSTGSSNVPSPPSPSAADDGHAHRRLEQRPPHPGQGLGAAGAQ